MLGIENLSWELDGWIIVAGILSAVSAALLGNFLVLRGLSLLGDAISHAVLPGLAAAFMISGSRASVPMFVGAVVVGVLTALFTEWIRVAGRVDEGASMGVVFTSLFALGLIMIVRAADHVDLDPGCVLYGAIEMTPIDRWDIGGYAIPRVVVVLGVVSLINLAYVVVLFKELKLTSFDPALATATGFPAWVTHYSLMVLVAVTAVASFESVGNILVVAMFIVPPAAAYMMTDRLAWMILLSVVIGVMAAILGHLSALAVPAWFGYRSTSTAGMMAVMTGVLFIVAALLGPRHGVLVRAFHHRALTRQILQEDIIGLMYRMEERGGAAAVEPARLSDTLLASPAATRRALRFLARSGAVERHAEGYRLTRVGHQRAEHLVRSHRLWEHYLASEAGVSTDRIHDSAERLEHFTTPALGQRLSDETASPTVDPHGSRIPGGGPS